MRVSQLLHVMHRDDYITINDFDKKIDSWEIYRGPIKGIHKDNPINRMHVMTVAANGYGSFECLVRNQAKKGERKNEVRQTGKG